MPTAATCPAACSQTFLLCRMHAPAVARVVATEHLHIVMTGSLFVHRCIAPQPSEWLLCRALAHLRLMTDEFCCNCTYNACLHEGSPQPTGTAAPPRPDPQQHPALRCCLLYTNRSGVGCCAMLVSTLHHIRGMMHSHGSVQLQATPHPPPPLRASLGAQAPGCHQGEAACVNADTVWGMGDVCRHSRPATQHALSSHHSPMPATCHMSWPSLACCVQ
jgi:hypothetical protein